MSRAFMPMYWGDYLRDTGHLTTEQHGAYLLLLAHCWQHGEIPADDVGRAAVARLTAARWKAMSATILRFFNEDGSHKRVKQEAEKAELLSEKRKLIGQRGGMRSAIARAKDLPSAKQLLEQSRQQTVTISSSNRGTIHNHIDKIPLETACARTPVDNGDEVHNPARSLATAHPTGALAREPDTEQAEPPLADRPKRPSELSRAELDAAIAKRSRPAEIDLTIPDFLRRTA